MPTHETQHNKPLATDVFVSEGAPDDTLAAGAETGLMLVEKPADFGEITAELTQQAGKLHGIDKVQRGLEHGIVGVGIQILADRYGGGPLLAALQAHGTTNFRDVINTLEPDEKKRQELYELIEAEPMDKLAKKLNEVLGGVAETSNDVDVMTNKRKLDISTVKGPTSLAARAVDALPQKHHRPDDGGRLTDTSALFGAQFDDLLAEHPKLTEDFGETNDTLGLLNNIREVYANAYSEFSANLAKAKAAAEAEIAAKEAQIRQEQQSYDQTCSQIIQELEEQLNTEVDEDTKAELQAALDHIAEEIETKQAQSEAEIAAVRTNITDALERLQPPAPAKARPTHNSQEQADLPPESLELARTMPPVKTIAYDENWRKI